MNLLDLFKRISSNDGKTAHFSREWIDEGLFVRLPVSLSAASAEALLATTDDASPTDVVIGAYLAQLAVEELCEVRQDGVLIGWARLYELLRTAEHDGALITFGIPPVRSVRPVLEERSTLTDADFAINVVDWIDGAESAGVERIAGAVGVSDGAEFLLPEDTWKALDEINRFNQRGEGERTQYSNELGWGRIRRLADAAGALYSTPYLESTYVLTPDTLRLPLLKEETPFGRVFTVAPKFENAPAGWLTAFDRNDLVQSHYDLASDSKFVRVIISEPVRRVLQVIKREMPGRRVAGSRAEKFIHNPWAFLGESAQEVISEEEFAQDRAEAGPVAAVFSVVTEIADGRLHLVALSVTEHFSDGRATTGQRPFSSIEQLAEFISALELALREDREWFPWQEFDLSINAESSRQLEQCQHLLNIWRVQPDETISYEDVYEIGGYSSRIEGIGSAKPIYVPVFQKAASNEGEGGSWLPDDLTPIVSIMLPGVQGQVLIPLTKQWVSDFATRVEQAEAAGASELSDPALPTPVETAQARTLVDAFRSMVGAQDKVKAESSSQPKPRKPPKQTLLVKLNFHGIDYAEQRKASLKLPDNATPVLPRSLRAGIRPKQHQLFGVAWFQHLVSKAPSECRGALLADDMGLGKTLQLLAVLGWYYEQNPTASPSLVLAPKSLLENWANEATKFFTPSFPELLVLYGDELQSRKQPLSLIDERLQARQVVELLRPNWVGSTKIIVTTYEVLTAYEFSFAKQPFAFVICDEAQRIKTPGTFVTLAAKKLKADFRVACTGTPVENSLADLWCLFDFVQPGLLGALEEFGKTYRRPIECETDEQRGALKSLQFSIAPQTLRRTKADIAHELPRKLFAFKPSSLHTVTFKERLEAKERLEIAMTDHQRILYKGGLKKLQDAAREIDGKKRARLSFGALHLMKAVCAEPYCLPGTKFLPDTRGREAHFVNSPKLGWLVSELTRVKAANEKAIVFTEVREAQAALFYFLREIFGLKPFIVNGDSQARQRCIDRFSASPGFDVIILSTLAAGAGLNVTAANHVFHFTRAWNPAKESQATDRAYRIGQERDVHVYCPIIVANDFVTFEVRLDELLKRKEGLASATLAGDVLTSMFNGSGKDVSLTDLVGGGQEGAVVPRRVLTLDDIDRLDGHSFELFCRLLWSKCGFTAQVTEKRGGDGGIDIVAFNGRDGELLQCKSCVRGEIGWDAVKEVSAGAARYQARFPGTRFQKVAVTNQRFTSSAVEQATANQVRLVTRTELSTLLNTHQITNHELDEEFMTQIVLGKEAA